MASLDVLIQKFDDFVGYDRQWKEDIKDQVTAMNGSINKHKTEIALLKKEHQYATWLIAKVSSIVVLCFSAAAWILQMVIPN